MEQLKDKIDQLLNVSTQRSQPSIPQRQQTEEEKTMQLERIRNKYRGLTAEEQALQLIKDLERSLQVSNQKELQRRKEKEDAELSSVMEIFKLKPKKKTDFNSPAPTREEEQWDT
jgi:hypothetical protein